MSHVRGLVAASLVLAIAAAAPGARADAPGGQMTWGVHVSLAPTWFDGLFLEQANDLDPKRREATLHRIQQLAHDKAMVAPIWLNAGMNGLGARVDESGIGLIPGYIFSAPYEDVKLRTK